MEEPLLRYSKFEDPSRAVVSGTKIFSSSEHVEIRAVFACIALVSFVVSGASCYAFPLLLTQILPNSVHLTVSETSFLGGLIYMSLGVGGATMLVSKKFNMRPVNEFVFWTIVCALIAVFPWILFYWIVTTPKTSGGHSVGVVVVAILAQGFASSISFNIWGMYLVLLFKEQYAPFVLVAIQTGFPLGAVLVFLAKYRLSSEGWVLMQLILQGSYCTVMVIYGVTFRNEILVLPVSTIKEGPAPVSTTTMIMDLLTGKKRETLSDAEEENPSRLEACDVTSVQFYFICISCFLFTSVGAAFMANIGPLTAHDDDSSAGERKQLGIFIAAMTGQLVGRALMPLWYVVVEYICTPKRPAEIRDNWVWQDYCQRILATWSNLGLTIGVCTVFIVCLLLLQLIPNFPYVIAFTVISAGYGMMWVITSNYRTFFHSSHLNVLGSFFLLGGAVFTIVLVSLISGLEMEKDGIFATLLVGSVLTLATALIAHVNMTSKQRSFLQKQRVGSK
jgi:uncharacterized membrane protein